MYLAKLSSFSEFSENLLPDKTLQKFKPEFWPKWIRSCSTDWLAIHVYTVHKILPSIKSLFQTTNETYSLSDFVHLMIQKVTIFIKVLIPQCPFSNHLVGYFSFVVHHQFEHFIVGFSRKHNLSCVKLKHCSCHRPQVYAVVILCSYN